MALHQQVAKGRSQGPSTARSMPNHVLCMCTALIASLPHWPGLLCRMANLPQPAAGSQMSMHELTDRSVQSALLGPSLQARALSLGILQASHDLHRQEAPEQGSYQGKEC